MCVCLQVRTSAMVRECGCMCKCEYVCVMFVNEEEKMGCGCERKSVLK